VTTKSFAITLYGQCCRLHVVQQVVTRKRHQRNSSCWSICSLCFQSNLLPRRLTYVPGTSILRQIPNI